MHNGVTARTGIETWASYRMIVIVGRSGEGPASVPGGSGP